MKTVLIPALAAGLVLVGCDQAKQDASEPPRPVLTVVAAVENLAAERFAGLVDAQTKINVSFQTVGRMISRRVDLGDVVQPGQSLAALDPVALEQGVRIAQASLASAQAVLVTATSAQSRSQALQQSGASTQASLDAADASAQAARSSVLQAQAELTKAQEQYSYAFLSSPLAGVVTSVSVEVGQVVLAGQTILTVAQPDLRDAVVDVPETIGQTLAPGTAFQVALELDPTIIAPGKVREITPFANPATRTRRIKIALADAPETFRLGSSITASLPDANTVATISLPASTLLEREGKTWLWVVDGAAGTVVLREVTLAERTATDISIRSGIRPGERIVSAGVHSLTNGQRIKLDSSAK